VKKIRVLLARLGVRESIVHRLVDLEANLRLGDLGLGAAASGLLGKRVEPVLDAHGVELVDVDRLEHRDVDRAVAVHERKATGDKEVLFVALRRRDSDEARLELSNRGNVISSDTFTEASE
jgi:hypothetical protein